MLFCLGFVTLALELILIRVLAANIWNLGFFPNLVLLAVFIGMGCGFLFHHRISDRRSPVVAGAATWVLLLLIALVTWFHPGIPAAGTSVLAIGGELFSTEIPKDAVSRGLPLLALSFVLVALVFASLSQRTAKLFRSFPPLTAYALDIGGSCAGIALFTAMSFFQLPAYAWFLALAPPLYVALAESDTRAHRLVQMAPLLFIALLCRYADSRLLSSPSYGGALEVHWSPYQKIEFVPPKLSIFANGIAFQGMHEPDELKGSFFEEIYRQRAAHPELPPYKNVLILGAGSGNDVMAALMNGVEHVDAVEIDPVVAGIGQRSNPGRPYDDPRVTLVIDDGRAFMTQTRRRYDLVIIAVTDSVVKISSMSQLRLENYLYTVDAFERGYALLTDTGDLAMYSFYRAPWLPEKLRRSLEIVGGKPPELLFERGDFRMLAVGRGRPPGKGTPLYAGAIDLPSDDWPFFYLRERGIPPLYVGVMGALLFAIALLSLGLRLAGPPLEAKGDTEAQRSSARLTRLAFFLMGAAFLLLETKSVVQFSLLFGTTWLNNSMVFLSVLLLVLAANWCASLLRGRAVVPVAYALLIGACLLSFAVPLGSLLHVASVPLRFVEASLLTFSPILFANLIFSVTFRDEPAPERAFGWNLIGATLGGVLEYASIAFGYAALAGVVAVLYTIVVVLLLIARRTLVTPPLPSAR